MALLTFALIQICLARANSGLDIMSSNTPSLSLESDGIDINLDLGNSKVYNSKSYKDAITFIEDLKTASSCHRLAASSLINVCQSINQDSSVELALADTKEEYAAKIAACELNVVRGRGKDAIPKPCKNFLPNKDACPKTQHEPKKRCYAPLSRVQITACINALEDRPQSWTSYSNALQNVQNACQASRLAIEKGTSIHISPSLDTMLIFESRYNSRSIQGSYADFSGSHSELSGCFKPQCCHLQQSHCSSARGSR